jgi:phage terminase small subunit
MTERQQRFVSEYVTSLNGAKAAIAAGYAPKAARAQAARLLTKADISAAVEAVQKKALNEAQATVERVIREYAAVAFLDPGDLFDGAGRLLPISKVPEESRRALAAFETYEATPGEEGQPLPVVETKRVRFVSKLGALHSLARHLGMFAERPDSGSRGLTIHLCESPEQHVAEQSESRNHAHGGHSLGVPS